MGKKFDFEEPDNFVVATVDIESLSLRMNALITEVGIIKCKFPHDQQPYRRWQENTVFHHTFYPDFLEQLKLGRHVDPKTIEWQERTFGVPEYRENLSRGIRSGDSLKEMFSQLKEVLSDCHEIWFKHPTFDAGRLNTLAEDLGLEANQWKHNVEQDIDTLKYHNGIEANVDLPGHIGINDCMYNMAILEKFALTRKCKWERHHGYVWTNND